MPPIHKAEFISGSLAALHGLVCCVLVQSTAFLSRSFQPPRSRSILTEAKIMLRKRLLLLLLIPATTLILGSTLMDDEEEIPIDMLPDAVVKAVKDK
jgi:hypothetical protein